MFEITTFLFVFKILFMVKVSFKILTAEVHPVQKIYNFIWPQIIVFLCSQDGDHLEGLVIQ